MATLSGGFFCSIFSGDESFESLFQLAVSHHVSQHR
jgi:hypothetical protein